MPNFTTPRPITAVIDAYWAFVHVTASDSTETVVEVKPHQAGKKAHVAAAEATRVLFADDRLEVITPKGRGLIGAKQSVDITIRLPRGSAVTGTTQAGDFRAEGRLASCEYRTGGGDITVDAIGAHNLYTAAGTITVDRVAGSGSVSTDYGRIDVREAVSGEVALESKYGDIVAGVHPDSAVTTDTSVRFGTLRNSVQTSDATATAKLTLRVESGHGDIDLHRIEATR